MTSSKKDSNKVIVRDEKGNVRFIVNKKEDTLEAKMSIKDLFDDINRNCVVGDCGSIMGSYEKKMRIIKVFERHYGLEEIESGFVYTIPKTSFLYDPVLTHQEEYLDEAFEEQRREVK